MKCPKCDGKGFKDNPKYWGAKIKYRTEYYLRFSPYVKCSNCNGIGYVIGNVKDVLDFLWHLEQCKFRDDKEYSAQVRECINAIDATFNSTE